MKKKADAFFFLFRKYFCNRFKTIDAGKKDFSDTYAPPLRTRRIYCAAQELDCNPDKQKSGGTDAFISITSFCCH